MSQSFHWTWCSTFKEAEAAQVSIDGGGAPQKLVEFDEDDIYDFGYSADGQQLAVTRGDYQFDAVMLSGLTQ